MHTMECEESVMKLLKYLYEREIIVDCKGNDKGRGDLFFGSKCMYNLLRNPSHFKYNNSPPP